MFLLGVFGGICGENSYYDILLLFMVLWGPISATLCKRAVMLWHAFPFLGLRFFLFYSFYFAVSAACSCIGIF
jgi:hypothetical protein